MVDDETETARTIVGILVIAVVIGLGILAARRLSQPPGMPPTGTGSILDLDNNTSLSTDGQ